MFKFHLTLQSIYGKLYMIKNTINGKIQVIHPYEKLRITKESDYYSFLCS